MPRPSPRTGTTGAGIQKFGTQQLKYLDTSQPALGVHEMDVGARSRVFGLFPSFGIQPTYSGGSTPFSQRYQEQRTGTVRTLEQLKTSDRVIPEGVGSFIAPDSFGVLFGNGEEKENGKDCGWFGEKCWGKDIDKHGCECEACKNGTGQCSDKRAECDAWDLGCELGGGFTDIITDPVSSWWDRYGIWVYVILGVIGLGILLWLLRPLFGVAKNVTGITKSAVTRVNGMK